MNQLSSPCLWLVCLNVRSFLLVGLALVGSYGEHPSWGNACYWACEKSARGLLRLVASSPVLSVDNPEQLHRFCDADCNRCLRILRHDLPREQLILRPTMLLLLAVRFEHVKEAMAVGCELCVHSKSRNAARIPFDAVQARPVQPLSCTISSSSKGSGDCTLVTFCLRRHTHGMRSLQLVPCYKTGRPYPESRTSWKETVVRSSQSIPTNSPKLVKFSESVVIVAIPGMPRV